jgi:hypothetical protein
VETTLPIELQARRDDHFPLCFDTFYQMRSALDFGVAHRYAPTACERLRLEIGTRLCHGAKKDQAKSAGGSNPASAATGGA